MPKARVSLLSFVLAIPLAACAARSPIPIAAPPAPTLAPMPGLRVVLTWSAPVDLDLYVTDPTGETTYFANNPSSRGARLLRDARCGDVTDNVAPFIELVHAPEAMPGRYRVGVDLIDACKTTPAPVGFRVAVELAGSRRETVGTIRLTEFQPIVVEFTLQRVHGDGSLVLSQEEE